MASSLVGTTSAAPGSAAAFATTLPAGTATGDRALLRVTGKYGGTTQPTIDQGWTLVAFESTLGTGAAGTDAGTMFFATYFKDLTSGSETAPTVTPGGTAPNTWIWSLQVFRPGPGRVWADAGDAAALYQAGSDTNTASPLTFAFGGWPSGGTPSEGDRLVYWGAVPQDVPTTGTLSLATTNHLSSSGSATYLETTTGTDMAMVWQTQVLWPTISPSTMGAPTLNSTMTSGTNHSGGVASYLIRDALPTASTAPYPTLVAAYRPTTYVDPFQTSVSIPVTVAVGDTLVATVCGDRELVDDPPTGGTGMTWALRQSFTDTATQWSLRTWTATCASAGARTLVWTAPATTAMRGVVLRYSGATGIGNTAQANSAVTSAAQGALTTSAANSAVVVTSMIGFGYPTNTSGYLTNLPSGVTKAVEAHSFGSTPLYALTYPEVAAAGQTGPWGSTYASTDDWVMSLVEVLGTSTPDPARLRSTRSSNPAIHRSIR